MPRNRSDVDREAKEHEIVVVAADLAMTDGPEAATLSNVARRLELARNAVTWYFPTRDDLLAAAFRHLVAEAVAGSSRRRRLEGRLEWATERLAPLRPVYLYLGSRAGESPAIAQALVETQQGLYSLLADSLRTRLEPDDVDVAAVLLGVFVEGLLARPRTARERRELIALATARLVPEPTR